MDPRTRDALLEITGKLDELGEQLASVLTNQAAIAGNQQRIANHISQGLDRGDSGVPRVG